MSYDLLPGRLPKRITVVDGCWIVRGPTTGGYGQVQVDGQKMYAHRVAYELFVGSIPDGMEVHHECRQKACCNPKHLRLVTRAENVRLDPRPPWPERSHCSRGHRLTTENTYIRPHDGAHVCRECDRARRVRR